MMTKELKCDTMAIGGGLAGTSAVLRAYESAESVRIIRVCRENSVTCRNTIWRRGWPHLQPGSGTAAIY